MAANLGVELTPGRRRRQRTILEDSDIEGKVLDVQLPLRSTSPLLLRDKSLKGAVDMPSANNDGIILDKGKSIKQ